jgi:hypothetical protein
LQEVRRRPDQEHRMGQALHIFKKDVRYLRLEIGIVLALALSMTWTERHPGQWLAETLFTLAACVLIARLVHAEAIPGDNQFWVTRPYRWQSLLGAKLGFVVLFVSVPLLLEQGFVAWHVGFSPATFWPGLLWCQALILFCTILPVTAMAALTPGLTSFISFALVLMGLELVTNTELRMLFNFLGPGQRAFETEDFGSVEWVRSSIALVGAALISTGVLYAQYKGRRTFVSRWFAVAAGVAFGSGYFLLPWTAALKFESVLSKRSFDASVLSLELDPKGADKIRGRYRRPAEEATMILPMVIRGISRDQELRTDAISISIQGPGGRTWASGLTSMSPGKMESGGLFSSVFLLIDPDFYRDVSTKPSTLSAKVFLTLLGDEESTTIPVNAKGSDAIEGLRCFASLLDQVACASAFRWPARGVYAGFTSWAGEAFTTSLSYSPFPAVIGFNPFETHWVSMPKDATTVEIIAKKPLSHFERDFEVQGVRLEEFRGK